MPFYLFKKNIIFLLILKGTLLISCSTDIPIPEPDSPFVTSIIGKWTPVDFNIKGVIYPYPGEDCGRDYFQFNTNSTFNKGQFIECVEQVGNVEFYKLNGKKLTLGYGSLYSNEVLIQSITDSNMLLIAREDHYGDGGAVEIITRYSRN